MVPPTVDGVIECVNSAFVVDFRLDRCCSFYFSAGVIPSMVQLAAVNIFSSDDPSVSFASVVLPSVSTWPVYTDQMIMVPISPAFALLTTLQSALSMVSFFGTDLSDIFSHVGRAERPVRTVPSAAGIVGPTPMPV